MLDRKHPITHEKQTGLWLVYKGSDIYEFENYNQAHEFYLQNVKKHS